MKNAEEMSQAKIPPNSKRGSREFHVLEVKVEYFAENLASRCRMILFRGKRRDRGILVDN